MAFSELRQYKVRQGKMDDWIRMMNEELIPFQISKGMVITGNFREESEGARHFREAGTLPDQAFLN